MNIRNRIDQAGFSIVEMMISITIGLLILAGLTSILVNNSRARTEIERANRQIENGRYALQLLSDDLRLAGYTAEFDPSVMALPGTLPDPCAVSLTDLRNNFMLHVQGRDDDDSVTPIPSCLSDVKSGTDILVIRRVSTCKATGFDGKEWDADCTAATNDGTPYFQASLCFGNTELGSNPSGNADYRGTHYQLDTNLANLTLTQRNCTDLAGIQRFRTHIYFIANNNNDGDGIPTLKRAELGGSGPPAIVALVDGIENLQIQYGIDLPIVDGVPDAYMADPCIDPLVCVNNWGAAVSAKINLLARNIEKTAGYSTTKTYTLGYNASGAPIVIPFTDSYKRHAYQSQVRLNNPAGRNM